MLLLYTITENYVQWTPLIVATIDVHRKGIVGYAHCIL